LENAEITSVCKIIGLNFKEKYETKDSMKSLRYGKIMIMTDQDHDGSHIKGLIINFIHFQWPNLLKHGFIDEFITPIIKVTKSSKKSEEKAEKSFYSMPEFNPRLAHVEGQILQGFGNIHLKGGQRVLFRHESPLHSL
jgi:DNA topoisomerase-2